MRPNVPVPSRRKVIPFLKMMHQETGSMLKAILAFGFDGPRTSSGGSFRPGARNWVRHRPLCEKHSPQKRESHLPRKLVPPRAGFRAEECAGHQATISGLSGGVQGATWGKRIPALH